MHHYKFILKKSSFHVHMQTYSFVFLLLSEEGAEEINYPPPPHPWKFVLLKYKYFFD